MTDANGFDLAETAVRVREAAMWPEDVCERYTRTLWALGLDEDEVVECARLGIPTEDVAQLWNHTDRPIGDLIAVYEGTLHSGGHQFSVALRRLWWTLVEEVERAWKRIRREA